MSNIPYPGELAALGTACCWTFSSLFFSAAGKRIGSLALNQIRLVMGFLFLSLYGWAVRGQPLPTDVAWGDGGWLFVSGLVGFLIGDMCLFRAFVLVGPRISMLMMSLAPLIASFTGWAVLGERLGGWDWVGMLVTLAGVSWVVLERPSSGAKPGAGNQDPSTLRWGTFLAFGGAAGQAIGMVLGKKGVMHYDPFAATQVRVLAGILGFGILFIFLGWWPKVWQAMKHRSGMGYSALGALAGPFLGVGLSLLAIKHTETGVAMTIMSITPILLIPFAVWVHKERLTLRAVLGAFLAVAGVAILFL